MRCFRAVIELPLAVRAACTLAKFMHAHLDCTYMQHAYLPHLPAVTLVVVVHISIDFLRPFAAQINTIYECFICSEWQINFLCIFPLPIAFSSFIFYHFIGIYFSFSFALLVFFFLTSSIDDSCLS